MRAADRRIRRGVARGAAFQFTVDGEPVEAYPGETIATALLADDRRTARRTAHQNAPRGVFCAIGVCHDCRMVVDGEANVRTCPASERREPPSVANLRCPGYPTAGNRPSTGYAGSVKPGVEAWPGTTRLSASISSSAVHS